MINLSDTQAILLSSASQRKDGSLLPLPSSLRPGGGVAKAMDALVKLGFAKERETSEAGAARGTEGDMRYGRFITTAGLVAIGVELAQSGDADRAVAPLAPSFAPPAAKTSKSALVLGLLGRPNGATLAELIEATGWLPHTTRAALTGIRKKGHDVERTKRGNTTCYRIGTCA